MNCWFPYLIGRIGVNEETAGLFVQGSFHTSQVGLEYWRRQMSQKKEISFHTSQVGLELRMQYLALCQMRVSIPHRQDWSGFGDFPLLPSSTVSIPHRQDRSYLNLHFSIFQMFIVSIPHRQDWSFSLISLTSFQCEFPYLIGRIGVASGCRAGAGGRPGFPYLIGRIGVHPLFFTSSHYNFVSIPHRQDWSGFGDFPLLPSSTVSIPHRQDRSSFTFV